MALPFAFNELSIMEFIAGLPVVSAGFWGTKPNAQMGGERIKVTAQPIGGGSGNAVGQKAMLEVMNERKSIVFGTTTDVK